MKGSILLGMAMAGALLAPAQNFESATSAARNIGIGWNIGNRLDACSTSKDDMWIEAWTDRLPVNYETAWGEVEITPELIHMVKKAGFRAIRLPVTWTAHIGNVIVDPSKTGWKAIWDPSTWTGYDVDPVWMARVHQVVDYIVKDEGMYCILNVHHDTGAGSSAWLHADEAVYAQQKERFEALWTQIANEFRDYGQQLIFEGYNEMLDTYNSWCFASMSTEKGYDATVARSAYNAINSYAQSFVNAVRATGGNNARRNLIVNTYGACSGEGTWSTHLADPLREMAVPSDTDTSHLLFQIHYYPNPKSDKEAYAAVESIISTLDKYLLPKGLPVVIGEYGVLEDASRPYLNTLAEAMTRRCKECDIPTFLWMELAGGKDCLVPTWTNPTLKDTIIKAYYGEEGGITGVAVDTADSPCYNLQGIPVTNPQRGHIYIRAGQKFRF